MPTERRYKEWLARVYGAADNEVLERAYDAWAGDYDGDLGALGYLNPAVVAGMVGRHLAADAGEILDVGAGTGIIGEVLAALGHGPLVAIDLSEGMLEIARAKGAYATCRRMVLGEELDFATDRFAATTASGVFTVGHAPAGAYDELARVTRPGGRVFLATSQHAEDNLGFGAKAGKLVRAGVWEKVAASKPFIVMPAYDDPGQTAVTVHVYQVNPRS